MRESPMAKLCTIHSHFLLIRDTDTERCPNCGRKLWRRPPTKCERHSIFACSECFSDEEFFKLRYGAEPISEITEEEEHESQEN